jgi:hypothetical protein
MRKKEKEKDKHNDNDLSAYGLYYHRYMGFDFKSIATGEIYTKSQFFDKFRIIAVKLSIYEPNTKPTEPQGFSLVKRSQ